MMFTSTTFSVNQKGFAPVLILVGIVFIGILAGGVYYLKPDVFNKLNKSSPKACSQIAKLCPDGSAVGRTGPNCEFSPCPSITQTQDETTNWKTYTDNKYYSIRYPQLMIARSFSVTELGKESNINIIENFTSIKGASKKPPLVLSASTIRNDNFLITIWIFNNDKKFNTNDWFQNYDYYPENLSSTRTDPEVPYDDLQVGSYTAKAGYPQGQFFEQGTFLPYQDKMLLFFTVFKGLDQSGDKTKVNQILSTFRFIDQNLTPTPTCMPRPACLDVQPRCLMPEPVNGWCVTPPIN